MTKMTTIAFLLLATAGACSKKPDSAPAAATKPTDSPTGAPAVAVPVVAAKPAAAPAPAATGPAADETKEFLGLVLAPMGKWKPTWDGDAKVAKWENEEYMTSIVVRVVKDKLDTIDDLKEAAPMMMQLGTAITKVDETNKTDKGWYAVVTDDEGKNNEMVYVRKFGSSQIVCSGNTTKRKDAMSAGGITKEEITKACESLKVK